MEIALPIAGLNRFITSISFCMTVCDLIKKYTVYGSASVLGLQCMYMSVCVGVIHINNARLTDMRLLKLHRNSVPYNECHGRQEFIRAGLFHQSISIIIRVLYG